MFTGFVIWLLVWLYGCKLNVDRFSSNLVAIGTESFCKTLLKFYKVFENRRNGSHIVRA